MWQSHSESHTRSSALSPLALDLTLGVGAAHLVLAPHSMVARAIGVQGEEKTCAALVAICYMCTVIDRLEIQMRVAIRR